MSFIGGLFNGSQGAGYNAGQANIDKVISPEQVNILNDQTRQSAYALQGYGERMMPGSNQALASQQNLLGQLEQQSQGGGPNPALNQLANTTGQNVQNQAALMASQRGVSANPALLARQAAQQGAQTQQQSAGQAAVLRSQQQLAAQQALQQQQAQLVGQQQNALGATNNAYQNQQNAFLGQINAQNNAAVQNTGQQANANSRVAAGNAQAQAGLLGGVLGGVGSALSLAHGGPIPSYSDGGESGPQSHFGKFSQGFNDASSQNSIQSGMSSLLGGIGHQAGNAMNYFNSPMRGSQNIIPEGFAGQDMGSGMNNSLPVANKGGVLDYRSGGHIPGKAKVSGDSLRNDTVPAMLSPGEVVIPRSVMNSEDPKKGAADFVNAILAKNSMRKSK